MYRDSLISSGPLLLVKGMNETFLTVEHLALHIELRSTILTLKASSASAQPPSSLRITANGYCEIKSRPGIC